MEENVQRRLFYFAVIILILLLTEFVQINNTNFNNYVTSDNSFLQNEPVQTFNNTFQGIAVKANLSIKETGIGNGSRWEAIINGEGYSTHSGFLNLSLPEGNYSISFYSRNEWGANQNISLVSGFNTIVEHFYRMENFSQRYSGMIPVTGALTESNYTALVGSSGGEIINSTTGTVQDQLLCSLKSSPGMAFLGISGSNFIYGGGTGTFQLCSFNPFTHAKKLIMDSSSISMSFPDCCQNWQFYLNSMAVWHNEAFISFRNRQTLDNSIFGIVYLNNSTFINLTGEFPSLHNAKISSCGGGGNFLVGINDRWFLVNGTTMNVSYEQELGNSLSPLSSMPGCVEADDFISFNGSSFILANQTRVIAFNSVTGTISDLYTAKSGYGISSIYSNSSVVLAGLNRNGNFSLAVLQSNHDSRPFITQTNATESVKGCITTIDPSGNIMLLAGTNSQSMVYLFTDSNYSGLTFVECGIQPGLSWSLTFNGKVMNTTGRTINFGNLSGGCYYYSVNSKSEFNSTCVPDRTYYERGESKTIMIHFSVTYTFRVANYSYYNICGELVVKLKNELNETLDNCYRINPITVSYQLPYGNYSYCALMTQTYTKAVKGSIVPQNGSNLKLLTLTKSAFKTTFNIMDGNTRYSQWCFQLDSTSMLTQCNQTKSYSYNTIKKAGVGYGQDIMSLQDNLYHYTVSLKGDSNDYNNQKTGSVCVNGTSTTINITLVNYYSVCISESGIPSYNSFPFLLKNNWGFTIYNNNTDSEVPGGSCEYYHYSKLQEYLPDGNYMIRPLSYSYRPIDSIYYFAVTDKPVQVNIFYVPVYHSVILTETGISTEYMWYVNDSNGNYSAYGGGNIKLEVADGLNCFTLTTNDKTEVPVKYYYCFMETGVNKSLTVKFSRAYRVKIIESGLPVNFKWYFNISNQKSESSTNKSLTALYPKGNYTFCSGSEGNVFSTHEMASHLLSVNGNESLNLSFVEYTERISFYFYTSNYPDMHFTMRLNGGLLGLTYYGNSSNNGRCTIASLNVPNGTYNFVANSNDSNYSHISGVIQVSSYGQDSTYLLFEPYTFYVTFRESGINKTTDWGIHILRGTHERTFNSSGFSTLRVMVTNGTYLITAYAGTSGYGSLMENYSMNINSTIRVVNVTFYLLFNTDILQSSSLFGGPASQFFSGLLLIAGISGLTSLMNLIRKRMGNLK